MDTIKALLKPEMPKSVYYQVLLENNREIFASIHVVGKIETAKQLGMSAQAFSTFYPILVAHVEIISHTMPTNSVA